MFVRVRRIFPGRIRSGRSEERRQLRSDPGKEMGQHPRGRTAARRHRRARRVQVSDVAFPRRLRRLLPERQTYEKFSRKEVDRKQSRENRRRLRSRIVTEDLRPNEVITRFALSSIVIALAVSAANL